MKVTLNKISFDITTPEGTGSLTAPLPGEIQWELTIPTEPEPPEPEPPEPEPEPPPAGWIVAPAEAGASASSAGTIDSPWTLQYAFQGAGGQVQPGATVYLRGGTYTHAADSDGDINVSGSSEAPITFRSYPGEWAVIDAAYTGRSAVRFFGSDVILRDVELVNSDPQRDVGQQGRSDLTYWKGPRCRLINSVLHDGGNAVGFWAESHDSEVYGCLIYNTGMWERANPAVTWGHSFYVQNEEGATKKINSNVALFPFRNGLDVYSATTAGGAGVTVEGNVLAYPGGGYKNPDEEPAVGINGTFSPGGKAEDFTFNRNVLFIPDARHTNWMMNGADLDHGRLECVGNEFIGGGYVTQWGHWDEAVVRENRWVGEYYLVHHATQYPVNAPGIDWDANEYFYTYGQAPGNPEFWYRNACHSWDQWYADTGVDRSSTYTYSAPTDLRVLIRPNEYERGRAWIIVINHSPETRALVSFDGLGLEPGERWEVIDAQNWPGGSILSDTYAEGSAFFLPLDRTEAPKPIGYDHQPLRDRRLNVFLVRRPLSEQTPPEG